jgi:hypothetical protein
MNFLQLYKMYHEKFFQQFSTKCAPFYIFFFATYVFFPQRFWIVPKIANVT